MKYYITFSKEHFHQIDGKIFDMHTVAMFEAANSNEAIDFAYQKFKNAYKDLTSGFDFTELKNYAEGIKKLD